MKTRRWWIVGPLIIVCFAVAANIAVAFRPDSVIDLGPIDLTPGTITSGNFRPGYAETYEIGVEMDRETAERLYPCGVSPEAMQKSQCRNGKAGWPIELSLGLSTEGRDLSREIIPNQSLAGGEYEGADRYTWMAGYVRLVAGTTYRLKVRSTGRASPLDQARPHLVVSAASAPGLLESSAILQIATLLIGFLAVMGATIWAMIGWRRHQLTLA